MPKPPNDKRVYFPHRGVVDQGAYIDTPGDAAPVGTIVNVRPRDPLAGRERGGKRPGLAEVVDHAGTAWGQIGDGPIQAIHSIARAAEQTGFTLGAGVATHLGFESRKTGDLAGNIYILRGKDSTPYISRHHAIGTAADFEDATDRDLTAVVWYGANKIAGGVNENPFDTSLDNLVFKSTFTNGAANNGFGTPGWSVMTNWDTGGAVYSVTGGPWPTEQVAVLYGDAGIGDILFVASSVTAGSPVGETLNKGFLIAYDLDGTSVATVAGGKVARLRLHGLVYHEATPGTPSTLTPGSVLVNTGAIEIPCIVANELDGVKSVYFVYDAARRGEAMAGRLNVTDLAVTGLDLAIVNSGSFHISGATFAVLAADFTRPQSPLDPHYLSINYPRAGKPTAIDVDPAGYVYFTCSSGGEGVYADPAAPSYRADHHPDYAGHHPITVCKVDPEGTYFLWESVTNYSTTEGGYARIADPELVWCKADTGDLGGCYVGGRTIGDANVFAVNGDDGGIRWRWRSGAAGGSSRTYAAAIDPDDGNLWVVGDRTNSYQGVVSSAYANLWKLSAESGDVLQAHDLGPGTNAISISINPANGLIAVGTLMTTV